MASDYTAIPPAPSAPLVSAPTNHEVAGFMPGRLEFEHEVDNEAEIPVKDMEFGLVYKYGGDRQPAAKPAEIKPVEEEEEEEDEDGVKEEEDEEEGDEDDEKPLAKTNGASGGKKKGKEKSKAKEKEKEKEKEEEAEEEQSADVVEDEDELEVKLALLEIYFSKLDKREEAKDLIFDRCLTEYKKVRIS